MRHHLQNTCRKQAHILLDVKPVKLQIADPGPRGGCVAQSCPDVRLGLQALPMGTPRVVHACVLRIRWVGERMGHSLGPGGGSQKEHSARSPEMNLRLSCPRL